MISERLASLLRRELRLQEFDFQGATKAFDVPGWDSLRHIEILTAIEDAYDIRLKGLEVLKLKNLGELQELIDRKVAAK